MVVVVVVVKLSVKVCRVAAPHPNKRTTKLQDNFWSSGWFAESFRLGGTICLVLNLGEGCGKSGAR